MNWFNKKFNAQVALMAKFKLIPYRIRLKEIVSGEEVSNLSDIDGNNTDFLNLLELYLREITEAKILPEEKRTIYINQIGREGRDLFGLAESGEYGLSANFVNINTKEITQMARRPHYSEAYPFLFYTRIPQNSSVGLLVLEKYRNTGIKTALRYFLWLTSGYRSEVFMTRKPALSLNRWQLIAICGPQDTDSLQSRH